MKTQEHQTERPSFWQLVFFNSRVNGAPYEGENLEGHTWNWPKDTYLQRRLQEIRWHRVDEATALN
jgi:hypothetical protein